MAEQIDLANINTESSLHALRQRYVSLNDQASDFLEKVSQHNQEVHDQMDKMQGKLRDMANNAAFNSSTQEEMIKDRIQHLMDQEHQSMLKLAQNEEKCRIMTADAKAKLANSKEQSEDSQQHIKDMVDEERQKEKDQQSMIQQRIADQEERIRDQQNR